MQIRALLDVVAGRGEHAVVYGERGVGKTSLAAVGALIVQRPTVAAVRVNCDGGDDFASIWRKALGKIRMLQNVPSVGFAGAEGEVVISAADALPQEPTPHDVETVLTMLERAMTTVIFFDEFDRVPRGVVSRLMADTIKTLSDQGVNTTIVLVGVADDVGQLIAEHESIERGLTQIPMPRMSGDELKDIVRRGLASVEMTIGDDAVGRITALSQGLPHYTHLLGQEAARSAVWDRTDNVEISDVVVAMRKAVDRSPHSLAAKYHAATSTPRAKTLYPDVILAAALARGDELGYVAAVDIRDPLRAITKKPYEIPAFSPHLHELTEEDRGCVLQKTGAPRRFRFRFTNPLLQPYVIMRALAEGTVDIDMVDRFLVT
jgi:Cdc6-like AAA superfamily ATPase